MSARSWKSKKELMREIIAMNFTIFDERVVIHRNRRNCGRNRNVRVTINNLKLDYQANTAWFVSEAFDVVEDADDAFNLQHHTRLTPRPYQLLCRLHHWSYRQLKVVSYVKVMDNFKIITIVIEKN